MTGESEIFQDSLLAFTLPDRHARGRAVRLDASLKTILSAHDYPPAIKLLLAEALVLTALIGGLLKDDGSQLTMQAQFGHSQLGQAQLGGGVVKLLVCDYRDGELRGYVECHAERLDELGPKPSLATLFGTGHLAVTFDLPATGQRYQGIVPLEAGSLAEACQSYFFRSEQVPTKIRVAATSAEEGCIAGGLLVQHLPDGEEGRERLHVQMDHPEWEHVAILAESVRDEELLDRELSLDSILWRLFHEEPEIRVQPGPDLSRGCRCTVEHFEDVLSRFPSIERAEMRNDDGVIVVDCAFCSRLFRIQD